MNNVSILPAGPVGSPGVLIEASALHALISEPLQPVVLDCSSVLTNPAQGRELYAAAHVPGAHFADLDQDLSDLSRKSEQGRHPLPDMQKFAGFLARVGLSLRDTARPIVCYDQEHGPYAARAFWLLRACGFASVRVLNGGLKAWCSAGYATASAELQPDLGRFSATVELEALSLSGLPSISLEQLVLAQQQGFSALKLIDARTADRFAGQNEFMDPIAGHVPGALNRPFLSNLSVQDGGQKFKSSAELNREFTELLGTEHQAAAVMCGSGVTACHHILAMLHAGLQPPALFAESWSGWILHPQLPRDPA